MDPERKAESCWLPFFPLSLALLPLLPKKIDMCFLWAQCPARRLGDLCSTHPSAQGFAAAAPPHACCQETVAIDAAQPRLFTEYPFLPCSVLGAGAQSGEETSVFAFWKLRSQWAETDGMKYK